MSSSDKKALIIGYGYTAFSIDNQLNGSGYDVTGVRRSWSEPEKYSVTSNRIEADITDPESFESLDNSYDLVVNCVAAGKRGDTERYKEVYLQGAQNLTDWASRNQIDQIIYTGSTTVHGSSNGDWVDENSERSTNRPTGEILKRTEDHYREKAEENEFDVNILRLTGIYGPDRTRSVDRMKSRDLSLKDNGNRFMNMIRREDIAQAVEAVAETDEPNHTVYNVTDSLPVREKHFYKWLGEQLEYHMPELSDESSRRPNKRVSNERLLSEFPITLQYPTFKEGYLPLI